jgi:hypothetical protein
MYECVIQRMPSEEKFTTESNFDLTLVTLIQAEEKDKHRSFEILIILSKKKCVKIKHNHTERLIYSKIKNIPK